MATKKQRVIQPGQNPSNGRFVPGNSLAGRNTVIIPRSKLPMVTDLRARGCRQVDVARALGVTIDTLNRIFERQPEVKEAYDTGDQMNHDALMNKMYQRATAGKHGDFPALAFLLERKHGYTNRDVEDVSGGRAHVVVNIVGSRSEEKVVEGSVILPDGENDDDLIGRQIAAD